MLFQKKIVVYPTCLKRLWGPASIIIFLRMMMVIMMTMKKRERRRGRNKYKIYIKIYGPYRASF